MKRFLSFVFVLVLLFSNSTYAMPQTAAEETKEVLELDSRSAVLVEAASGKVIYEKNADERLKPASVTKVMTLLLIFDEIAAGKLSYDDIVTVSEHAASMGGSQCFFEQGEQQTVRDMIKCIEVASGNDAAVAMAEHIAGSEQAFCNMMNERAKELGMVNTNFENACGLESSNHYTCARDIALMSRELMVKHPEITEFSTIWMDSIIHKTKRGESRFDLANTNKFLNMYQGATGLKTGYTSQAKYCMSATAKRNDIELIAVIMGAETKEIRNGEACRLLDYGFSRCKLYTDTEVLSEKPEVEIKNGVTGKLKYHADDTHSMVLLDENPDNIVKKIIMYDLKAPVYKDDIVGSVQYSVDGELISESFIYADNDIEEMTMKYSVMEITRRIFIARD